MGSNPARFVLEKPLGRVDDEMKKARPKARKQVTTIVKTKEESMRV